MHPKKHSKIIVYENIGGSGGGKIHILWVSASNYVGHDQTPQKSSLGTHHYQTVTQGSNEVRVYW